MTAPHTTPSWPAVWTWASLPPARLPAPPVSLSAVVYGVVRQRREQGWHSLGRRPSRPGRSLAVQDGGFLQRAANLLRTRTSLGGVTRKLGLNFQTLRNYKAGSGLTAPRCSPSRCPTTARPPAPTTSSAIR